MRLPERHADRFRWHLALLLIPLLIAARVLGDPPTTTPQYVPISPEVAQRANNAFTMIGKGKDELEIARLIACGQARLMPDECGQWDSQGRIPNLKPTEAKK